MTSSIVKRIKIGMIDKDMNQSELAKIVGVKPPTISNLFNYEQGSNNLIKKIAIVLDIDYKELQSLRKK